MTRITILAVCFLTISFTPAQKKAVTEIGEEVILFNDGTWEYQNQEDFMATEIPTNPHKFQKDEESSFLLKSNRLNIGFWLDPKTWSFKKSGDDLDSEYDFEMKGEDLYGLVITEKFEVPLQTLKILAVENGREVAPDLKVVKEEYRDVNGLKVLLLQMNGTMKGIKISYYGYYFSSINGTVQFITFSSQNLMESLELESEKLLNGLVEL
ncbi:MAG: hypothetical protein WBA61_04965 [Aequorivita sp.]